MQCINKLKAGLDHSGNITFKQALHNKELAAFEFECRKCLACRLNIAREKSIRAWHESKMHKDSIFLTLTYDDAHLKSDRLVLEDFQNFMKRLREKRTRYVTDPDLKKEMQITCMYTGEYGDKYKRPHWHALIFNYRPNDYKLLRTTDLGHNVFSSKEISDLWGNGLVEFGDITIESAGYVARYGAKKLIHGKDDEHDFHPIHRTSSKNALGKSWIEKYWKQTFDNGYVVLPNGSKGKIPRYYTDWLKKNHPDEWRSYVMNLRQELQEKAQKKNREEEMKYLSDCLNAPFGSPLPIKKNTVRDTILKQKFKRLQGHTKL